MTDERKTIGSGGTPGRGNRETSPSAAARSLAGGSAAPRKAVAKKKVTEPVPVKKVTPRKAPAAKKPAAKKPAGAKPAASQPPPAAEKPRLRAVTDEDAAAAAAAAAEEAARRTRTAGAAPLSAGIPLDEIVVAVVQAAQRVLGTDWESRIATLLATVRKRLSGDYEIDEFGFDPQIAEVLSAAVEPIAEKWFRLEVRGIENIPEDGGALLVANHSGTVPLDGLITGYAVKKYAGRHLRPLGADLVFSLPIVGQVARKVGATLACQEDAERLLTSGELAGVWPEGFKGIGKPFAERYKLQRFGRGGFVSSAMRAGVPIVPVSIVGAEEIYPLVGNVPSLARLLGLPYLPITPFFPLLGPLGMVPLPSKWIIEFGEPVRTDAYEPEAADDPMLLFNVTDQVRETIQQTLYKLLVDRGNAFF
ncbi:lysophospholipid acyltransferase family protein [Aeromicrobium stalagmiti]|uniref:lysophospholipid acyltransferase family protein n=1 Tax=Aeromicrobium stalagmiti TaxID=2738988 RepID=UPI001568786A|nr:lysophospholipid acyltransferase family protein [Aeromicrobium stalagmiti]NRQ48555.1 acyltransferase family protein [Aeromicrobium stalagmiti]